MTFLNPVAEILTGWTNEEATGEWIGDVLPVIDEVTKILIIGALVSLAGKEKYSRVVMIEFPRKGQYALALVTGVTPGEVQEISSERVINVYVPTSPNPTSGYLLFVPESELIPVSMTVDEAMKMMFSGGMYTPAPPASEAVVTGAVRR